MGIGASVPWSVAARPGGVLPPWAASVGSRWHGSLESASWIQRGRRRGVTPAARIGQRPHGRRSDYLAGTSIGAIGPQSHDARSSMSAWLVRSSAIGVTLIFPARMAATSVPGSASSLTAGPPTQ